MAFCRAFFMCLVEGSAVFSERATSFNLPASGMILAAVAVPTDIIGSPSPVADSESSSSTTLCFVVRESQPQFLFMRFPPSSGGAVGELGESYSSHHGDIAAVSVAMSSLLPWAGSYRAPPMDVHCVSATGTRQGFEYPVTKICALDRHAHSIHVVTCASSTLRHPESTMSMIELQNIEMSSPSEGDHCVRNAFVQSSGCLSSMLLRPGFTKQCHSNGSNADTGAGQPASLVLWSTTSAHLFEIPLFGGRSNECRITVLPGIPESVHVMDEATLVFTIADNGSVYLLQPPLFSNTLKGHSTTGLIRKFDTRSDQPYVLAGLQPSGVLWTHTLYPVRFPMRTATHAVPSGLNVLSVNWNRVDAVKAGVDLDARPDFFTSFVLKGFVERTDHRSHGNDLVLNYHGFAESGEEVFDVVDVARGIVKRVVAWSGTPVVSKGNEGLNSNGLASGLIGNGYSRRQDHARLGLPPSPKLWLVPLPRHRVLSVDRVSGRCVVWDFNLNSLKEAFQQWRLLTGWDQQAGQKLELEAMSEAEYRNQQHDLAGGNESSDGTGTNSSNGGDGTGNGDGGGNGNGDGNGNGNGNGNGGGEGKGSGSGRGGQPMGTGQATGKSNLEDIVFRDPMAEFEVIEFDGHMEVNPDAGSSDIDLNTCSTMLPSFACCQFKWFVALRDRCDRP